VGGESPLQEHKTHHDDRNANPERNRGERRVAKAFTNLECIGEEESGATVLRKEASGGRDGSRRGVGAGRQVGGGAYRRTEKAGLGEKGER